MQEIDVSPMDLLCQRLKGTFPEIIECSVAAGNQYFDVDIAEGTQPAPFMKTFDGFVKEYLDDYGDNETEYDFKITRGRELINIITYNNPERGYLVDVTLNGKLQTLFVVDVMGATGEFTVFNDDFETVGFMNMRGATSELTDLIYDSDWCFPNFSDSSRWEASNHELDMVLEEIIAQIAEELEGRDEARLDGGID
ncbi:MAG: hypothetical protein EOO91_02275 [Pedobacter sp.]|nr:MAG: hypothetical protein EOO91_02275 [Pedobacter sp.]